ncbi:MAG TPA: hypothetical protein VMV82_03665 [Candidatus Dormibacteraeota bacterium]|nr:hypothetical protein [Candidatus Dormibacteraeota bacterium]
MKRPIRSILFAASVAALCGPLAFAVQPTPAAASNIFCGADGSYVPWDAATNAPAPKTASSERALRVVLYAASGSRVTALVTFITNDSAYQATIAGVPLHEQARAGDRMSDPVLVTFDRSVGVQYAYVDSYAVDGAALVSCPSFVNQVYPWGATPRPNSAVPSLHIIASSTVPTMPRRYAMVAATLLQPLPSLACGAAYAPSRMALQPRSDWSAQDEMASYSSGRGGTSALVAIYLDSNGKPVYTQLVQSSGNAVTDTEALDDAKTETYSPAKFLCMPVVSLLLMPFQQK